MRTTWPKLSAVVLLTGCATEPHTDLFSVVGVVRGTVVTAEQAPAAGAQVVAIAEYTFTNGATLPLMDSVRTDASGRYVVTLQLVNVPEATVPAQILVRPAGTQPAGQSGPLLVRMRAGAARDTVVADVVVGP